MNDLPTPPLTPQTWCRRVLTSLNQRQVAGREAGYLEMLLTYFIERDPSVEAFGTLLAQYADDARPGIAEAAGLLQRSWQRGRAGAAAMPFPALAEVLRTLGGLLDDAGARYGYLAISREAVRLVTLGGELSQRSLDLAELQQEIAARTALRGQVPPADPDGPARREALLREVGTLLDQEPEQAYDLIVAPRAVIVDGSEGYSRVFSDEELTALAYAAVEQRADAVG